MPRTFTRFLIFPLLLALSFNTWAQSGLGTLKGKITDKSTGEALIGATVFLVGTYKGGASDINGNFELKGIKPGDYTVKFTYLGYNEKVFNGVSIKPDADKVLNVTLSEQGAQAATVEIVGEKNVVDLESGKSEVKIGATDIQEMNVRNVQDLVAMQAGVSQSPDGLQIRGGRVYETVYMVDGISAGDPLAGTGFGVEVSSGSVQDLSIVTGGSDAEYNSTSGLILTKVKEGGERFKISGNWTRDHFGGSRQERLAGPRWNTDLAEIALGGSVPGTKKKLRYFTSANVGFTDNYFKLLANQLNSSIIDNSERWAPRMDNKWVHTAKLSFLVNSKLRISILNQHSLAINQNSRTLQIIGFNQIMQPGLQWAFANQLDNATTYTHRSNLTALNLQYNLGKEWTLNVDIGRLSTNLRADANGRPFRYGTIDRIFDARSIATTPAYLFETRDLPFVINGDGLFNNNGISGVWHDHYVEEYTVKYKFNWFDPARKHFANFGHEHKEQYYQWVDVTSPWVGAPIQLPNGQSTPSTSIGTNSDLWRVKPAQGRFFAQDEIRYKGIIATLGASLEYWAPGKFADKVVTEYNPLVTADVREDYQKQTFSFIDGRRYKARLLPRLRVSFPVTENNVLYFNYGHSMRLPHPRFVYGGLDTNFQNRSVNDIGNPAINPEVCVSYEVGLKSQITKDFGITATAFYKDYFDYIVNNIKQFPQGNLAFSTNQDYARVRGVELGFNYRISRSFRAALNMGYQVATGKSNTAAESRQQIFRQGNVDLTKEQYLAWDRPFDAKVQVIFTPDSTWKIGPVSLKNFRVFVSSTAKSGLRYTPVKQTGTDIQGRAVYEIDDAKPFSKIGSAWYWTDIRITRDFTVGRLRASFMVEIKNLFNNQNAQIINPVTGTAYRAGDNLLYTDRDPRFPSPQDRGTPPNNPARWMEPRQVLYGISFNF